MDPIKRQPCLPGRDHQQVFRIPTALIVCRAFGHIGPSESGRRDSSEHRRAVAWCAVSLIRGPNSDTAPGTRNASGHALRGFARMNIDGHFPRWGISEHEAGSTAEAILDLFIEGIAKR